MSIVASMHGGRAKPVWRPWDPAEAGAPEQGFIWIDVGLRPARLRQAPVIFVRRRSQSGFRELRTRGFNLRGATMVRARMQALRFVNDHKPRCFRVSGLVPS